MKTMTTACVKSAPKFVDATHVLVTKEFAKRAMIYGTAEYKLWRELLAENAGAEMVTKTIKKNPNRMIDTKNMTYENMAAFIRAQDNATVLMKEFKKEVALSQIQTSPYRHVLAWFIKKFENYASYKSYFAEIAEKNAKEKDIFRTVKFDVSIEDSDAE